jgi:hypothetical protein
MAVLATCLHDVLQAVIPEYAPELHQDITAAAGNSSSSDGGINSRNALLQRKRKTKTVPGPAPTTAAAEIQPATNGAAAAAAAVQKGSDIGAAVAQLSLGALVQALLPASCSDSSASNTSNITSDTTSLPLSAAMRTAVQFRVSKKMLLMDVCVAAGVPLAVLQQYQAGRLEASTCHALPWQETGSNA